VSTLKHLVKVADYTEQCTYFGLPLYHVVPNQIKKVWGFPRFVPRIVKITTKTWQILIWTDRLTKIRCST